MVVCLESFLLQNLAMNALVLALALRLAGRRLKPGRLALAAGLGTAYAYLSCLQRAAFLRGVPFQILCVLCMCLLVLGSVRPRSFLRLAGFCYAATLGSEVNAASGRKLHQAQRLQPARHSMGRGFGDLQDAAYVRDSSAISLLCMQPSNRQQVAHVALGQRHWKLRLGP